jgi:hypothetical protein
MGELDVIGFQETEKFELPPVQDGESQELREKAVKELKKSAIKEEIKTGEKPVWADDVKRAEDHDAGGQEGGPRDPEPGHDGGHAERPGDVEDVDGGYKAPPVDGDTQGLLELFYDDLFKLLAYWTKWPGFKNTPELNQLYARNTGYFFKKLDPRIIGFLMISVVTLGKVLGFKEYRDREKQQGKAAGNLNVDFEKASEAAEAEKAGSQ